MGRNRTESEISYPSESEEIDGMPAKSVEGWVIFVSNVHEETQEEDVRDVFGEFGKIANLHLNLDRRTGFAKGYMLLEYKNIEEAEAAISKMNGSTFLGKEVQVDWAFVGKSHSDVVQGVELFKRRKRVS